MSGPLATISVLVVDDEKLIAKLVRDVLTKLGFSAITTATSGREAIDLFRRKPFDMIITDWRMDDMDGMDLIRFVRHSSRSPNPRVPILLLTGNTEKKEVLFARDTGVTEYLIKPFSARQLVDRIKFVIEKPRSFVDSRDFRGPDRRRQSKPPHDGIEKRKRCA